MSFQTLHFILGTSENWCYFLCCVQFKNDCYCCSKSYFQGVTYFFLIPDLLFQRMRVDLPNLFSWSLDKLYYYHLHLMHWNSNLPKELHPDLVTSYCAWIKQIRFFKSLHSFSREETIIIGIISCFFALEALKYLSVITSINIWHLMHCYEVKVNCLSS